MRQFVQVVFDDVVYAGTTAYTSSVFEELLASCEQLAIQVVTDQVSTTGVELTLGVEGANNGRSYQAAVSNPIDRPSVSQAAVNSTVGTVSGTPLPSRVRLSVALNTGNAHIRISVCGRDTRRASGLATTHSSGTEHLSRENVPCPARTPANCECGTRPDALQRSVRMPASAAHAHRSIAGKGRVPSPVLARRPEKRASCQRGQQATKLFVPDIHHLRGLHPQHHLLSIDWACSLTCTCLEHCLYCLIQQDLLPGLAWCEAMPDGTDPNMTPAEQEKHKNDKDACYDDVLMKYAGKVNQTYAIKSSCSSEDVANPSCAPDYVQCVNNAGTNESEQNKCATEYTACLFPAKDLDFGSFVEGAGIAAVAMIDLWGFKQLICGMNCNFVHDSQLKKCAQGCFLQWIVNSLAAGDDVDAQAAAAAQREACDTNCVYQAYWDWEDCTKWCGLSNWLYFG